MAEGLSTVHLLDSFVAAVVGKAVAMMVEVRIDEEKTCFVMVVGARPVCDALKGVVLCSGVVGRKLVYLVGCSSIGFVAVFLTMVCIV